jgi:hypothetical protein
LRLAKDGKEVVVFPPTSPSVAGASRAEPTPDMLAGALMNCRKTLRREVRVCS